MSKEKEISLIVSGIILKESGKFVEKTILDKSIKELDNLGNKNYKDIDFQTYVKDKLLTMCNYGLIGKTELYYFSI